MTQDQLIIVKEISDQFNKLNERLIVEMKRNSNFISALDSICKITNQSDVLHCASQAIANSNRGMNE